MLYGATGRRGLSGRASGSAAADGHRGGHLTQGGVAEQLRGILWHMVTVWWKCLAQLGQATDTGASQRRKPEASG